MSNDKLISINPYKFAYIIKKAIDKATTAIVYGILGAIVIGIVLCCAYWIIYGISFVVWGIVVLSMDIEYWNLTNWWLEYVWLPVLTIWIAVLIIIWYKTIGWIYEILSKYAHVYEKQKRR